MSNRNALNLETNLLLTAPVVQIFTSSGTYTPNSKLALAVVEIVGGGGSGGGVPVTSGQTAAASGGGGAGYCKSYFTPTQIGASAAVTIGAGGAASGAGNNPGNVGGQSIFNPAGTGLTLTAAAGGAGNSMAATTTPDQLFGGAGGSGVNGDINIQGQNAGFSYTNGPDTGVVVGGKGGDSQFGHGAPANGCAGLSSASFGDAPTGYGAGSCGAYGCNSASAVSSLAGTDGICIITEFLYG